MQNTHDDDIRLRELATAPIGRLLVKYSLPAVTGTVVSALYNIIDSIVIGHAIPDPNVVAGIAVTFPVMTLATALGMLIGAGAATRVSIVLGQKDLHRAEVILGNSVQLSIIIGLLYALCFAIFIDPILMMFGASPATLPYAREFVRWVLPGMVLINLTFSYNNVMRASGYP
ncbi:MAG: MATE family efflux transporter, partial [Muribaculaceae bacterium]|nr:MATE family efflux transporter [Muribaculaceae bacterium]